MHASCSICGDIFTGSDREVLHTTPCGHVFHYVCLLEWLQRSKTCPHCRSKVDEKKTIKLYFQLSNYTIKDSGSLENELQSLKFQVTLKNIDLKKLTEEGSKLKTTNKELRNILLEREEEIRCHTTIVTNLQNQIKVIKSQLKTLTETQKRVQELENKLNQYESVEKILNGSVSDAAEALTLMKDNSDPSILCTCISALKKEVSQYKAKSRDFQILLKSKENKLFSAVSHISKLEERLSMLERSLDKVKEDLTNSEKENETLSKKCKKLEEAITSPGSETSSNNIRDKVLRRLINEFPIPNLKSSSLIDLDLTVPVNNNKNTCISPGSTVPAITEIKKKFLLNKRRVFPKSYSVSDVQCYDGMGGHVKEEVVLTDRATLLNAIEKSKSNKILPSAKRMKTSNTTKHQPNLLQFGIKKV